MCSDSGSLQLTSKCYQSFIAAALASKILCSSHHFRLVAEYTFSPPVLPQNSVRKAKYKGDSAESCISSRNPSYGTLQGNPSIQESPHNQPLASCLLRYIGRTDNAPILAQSLQSKEHSHWRLHSVQELPHASKKWQIPESDSGIVSILHFQLKVHGTGQSQHLSCQEFMLYWAMFCLNYAIYFNDELSTIQHLHMCR